MQTWCSNFTIAIILSVLLPMSGCDKTSTAEAGKSYSVCPIVVTPMLDTFNQVDYSLSGYGIASYSSITVCFRRIAQNGNIKGYAEITDTRENPNTYQTYHTYKKLGSDEIGVKVRWVELTNKETGLTDKYINY